MIFGGHGAGRSSTDAAFDHGAAAEVAHLQNEHTITVPIDIWKCDELVDPRRLMEQAARMGFPLRLAWMSVQLYFQPRVLQAYGSATLPFASAHGIIAGCSLATTLPMVLFYTSVKQVQQIAPTVRARLLEADAREPRLCSQVHQSKAGPCGGAGLARRGLLKDGRGSGETCQAQAHRLP